MGVILDEAGATTTEITARNSGPPSKGSSMLGSETKPGSENQITSVLSLSDKGHDKNVTGRQRQRSADKRSIEVGPIAKTDMSDKEISYDTTDEEVIKNTGEKEVNKIDSKDNDTTKMEPTDEEVNKTDAREKETTEINSKDVKATKSDIKVEAPEIDVTNEKSTILGSDIQETKTNAKFEEGTKANGIEETSHTDTHQLHITDKDLSKTDTADKDTYKMSATDKNDEEATKKVADVEDRAVSVEPNRRKPDEPGSVDALAEKLELTLHVGHTVHVATEDECASGEDSVHDDDEACSLMQNLHLDELDQPEHNNAGFCGRAPPGGLPSQMTYGTVHGLEPQFVPNWGVPAPCQNDSATVMKLPIKSEACCSAYNSQQPLHHFEPKHSLQSGSDHQPYKYRNINSFPPDQQFLNNISGPVPNNTDSGTGLRQPAENDDRDGLGNAVIFSSYQPVNCQMSMTGGTCVTTPMVQPDFRQMGSTIHQTHEGGMTNSLEMEVTRLKDVLMPQEMLRTESSQSADYKPITSDNSASPIASRTFIKARRNTTSPRQQVSTTKRPYHSVSCGPTKTLHNVELCPVQSEPTQTNLPQSYHLPGLQYNMYNQEMDIANLCTANMDMNGLTTTTVAMPNMSAPSMGMSAVPTVSLAQTHVMLQGHPDVSVTELCPDIPTAHNTVYSVSQISQVQPSVKAAELSPAACCPSDLMVAKVTPNLPSMGTQWGDIEEVLSDLTQTSPRLVSPFSEMSANTMINQHGFGPEASPYNSDLAFSPSETAFSPGSSYGPDSVFQGSPRSSIDDQVTPDNYHQVPSPQENIEGLDDFLKIMSETGVFREPLPSENKEFDWEILEDFIDKSPPVSPTTPLAVPTMGSSVMALSMPTIVSSSAKRNVSAEVEGIMARYQPIKPRPEDRCAVLLPMPSGVPTDVLSTGHPGPDPMAVHSTSPSTIGTENDAAVRSPNTAASENEEESKAQSYVANLKLEQITDTDEDKDTMLHIVLDVEGHKKLYLLKAMCSRLNREDLLHNFINAINTSSRTPLYMALLSEPYDEPLRLMLVQELLNNGADVNHSCCHGSANSGLETTYQSAAHLAASLCHHRDLQLLLKSDKSAVNKQNTAQERPLHCAVKKHGVLLHNRQRNACDTIRVLIDHDADISAKAKVGKTILHMIADDKWDVQFLRFVLELIPESKRHNIINAKDDSGNTVLHLLLGWASRLVPPRTPKLLKQMLQLFLEFGADPKIKDSKHRTPQQFTKDEDIKELIEKVCRKRTCKKAKNGKQCGARNSPAALEPSTLQHVLLNPNQAMFTSPHQAFLTDQSNMTHNLPNGIPNGFEGLQMSAPHSMFITPPPQML